MSRIGAIAGTVFRMILIGIGIYGAFVFTYGLVYKQAFAWHHQYMQISGILLFLSFSATLISEIREGHDDKKT